MTHPRTTLEIVDHTDGYAIAWWFPDHPTWNPGALVGECLPLEDEFEAHEIVTMQDVAQDYGPLLAKDGTYVWPSRWSAQDALTGMLAELDELRAKESV
jgi:hypothetical protein